MKMTIVKKFSFILFIMLMLFMYKSYCQTPQYVWSNPEGSGRQQKVLFRNDFEISVIPGSANLFLFASSRYHIYINGNHLNFGPTRFYPANPRYDTYDLAPYLVKGKNVVAIDVLANGMETFQIFESIGSLISWGNIDCGNKMLHSFETPGTWKMQPVSSMDTLAPKFSFACGALEILDAQKQPFNWESASFDDTQWQKPVLVARQDYWGKQEAREIPPLSQDEITAFRCLGIYGSSKAETFYSFYQKTPDENEQVYGRGQRLAGYTWIFSPIEQSVELGTWWGDYFLNGEGPLNISSRDSINPVRENRIFNLKKGWNFLFVSYQAIWGAWEFTLAVPVGSELEFTALKKHQSSTFFKTTGALNPSDSEKLTAGIKKGNTDPETILKQISWREHENEIPFKNPARELVWNHPDPLSNLFSDDYQTGNFFNHSPTFYFFDLGRKILGRIFVEADAPAGTIIELGWSEDLNQYGMPYLYKRLQINAGARFICDGKRTRYETFKPYGIRYLELKMTPPPGLTASLTKVGAIEQVYPYNKTGSFECSDPMFNKIWELGWRTLRVCSEDSYIDTPFRERGLYAGDALPEYAITLATSGDSRLMKNSLLLFQDMYREELRNGINNRHNDFILKTLIELNWYYHSNGDTSFVRKIYPNYITYLDSLEKNKTSQGYYKVGMVFLEWTQIKKTADLTAYQALLYGSLRIMESMSADFGYPEKKEQFQKRADALRKVILDHFWDEEKECFFDGFENGKKIDHYYPISTYYPLLFQVVSDKEQKEKMIRFLDQELKDIGEESRNQKTTPYGAFYLFASLYENEAAGLAERFLKQYWTRMIIPDDDTSWEDFNISKEGTSSHAWSGHPTFFLSTEALGVQLGFNKQFSRDTIYIRPQSETLSWAKGTVPHPAGVVGVGWHISGDFLFLNLTIPENVQYVVEPKGRLAGFKLITTIKYSLKD